MLRFRVCFGALLEGNKEHPKTQHTRKRRFWKRSTTCIFGRVAYSGALCSHQDLSLNLDLRLDERRDLRAPPNRKSQIADRNAFNGWNPPDRGQSWDLPGHLQSPKPRNPKKSPKKSPERSLGPPGTPQRFPKKSKKSKK